MITIESLLPWDLHLRNRSYLSGFAPSQADVQLYKAMRGPPAPGGMPHLRRWFRHIASFESEFATLTEDTEKELTSYLPTTKEMSSVAGMSTDKAITVETDTTNEDVDLFGGDKEENDDEAQRVREERLKEYERCKSGKTKPAAKTSVTLDVKPWDDETPMEDLEANVRMIEKEGLVWGRSQLVALGFGIKKLQINLVVEDAKISVEDLKEEIELDEDHVQSTDVAAMQKL